jgi:hypothetical protein
MYLSYLDGIFVIRLGRVSEPGGSSKGGAVILRSNKKRDVFNACKDITHTFSPLFEFAGLPDAGVFSRRQMER